MLFQVREALEDVNLLEIPERKKKQHFQASGLSHQSVIRRFVIVH